MRIAMTIHALTGGGAERVFCQLASRWSAAGHEVHVITWSATDTDAYTIPAEVNRYGLDLLQASSNFIQAMAANYHRLRSLRHTLVAIQPQVVLSFCDQMNISTLQAMRGLDVPVWIAERSDPSQQRLGLLRQWWRLRVYPRCTGCIVQTQAIADQLSRLIPRERLRVIPNAVIPPAMQGEVHSPTNEGDRAGEATATKTILAVGRLSPEKGYDLLLQAWRSARAQLGQWELQIAGTGVQQTALQQQSTDLPRVTYLGWVDKPAAIYANSEIFVLPSRYEGFPNALLEAMSHGLPCIATRCSQAIDELSRNGTAVLVVEPHAPEQLAAAMIELAHSPARRAQLAAAALSVSREYAWERIGPLWDRVLG